MTFEQATDLLAVMKAAYPNAYKGMTLNEAEGVCVMWTKQFERIEGNLVMLAVKRLIKKNTFAPSIAEVWNELTYLYEEANGALMYGNLYSLYSEDVLKKLRYIADKLKILDKRQSDNNLIMDLKDSDMLRLGGGGQYEKIQE